MQTNLNFTRDADGTPRATAPPEQELLARFLESDIQGSTALLDDVIRFIQNPTPAGTWRGNACALEWAEGRLVVSPQWEKAPPLYLNVDDMRAALEAWRAFLSA